jgi:single-stranded DNA-binding protein
MDLNIVVIAGTLSAPPEIRTFESGAKLARYLVTVRSTEPRKRVDVIPVVQWDPPDDGPADQLDRGDRVWVVATVQRRFWTATDGRRSRLEVIAHHIQDFPEEAEAEAEAEAGGEAEAEAGGAKK